MLGKGLVRVRGRSDDGQSGGHMNVFEHFPCSSLCQYRMSGECQGKPGERQVNFR